MLRFDSWDELVRLFLLGSSGSSIGIMTEVELWV